MRKLIIIFMFLAVNVWFALGWTPPSPITPPDTIPDDIANMNFGITGGSVPVAPGGSTVDNCPDATYDFAWTGDNTAGVLYGCLDNGTSTVLGEGGVGALGQTAASTGAGYGLTGNGAETTEHDNICFAIDEATTTGTIWLSVYFDTTAPSNDNCIIVGMSDPDEYLRHTYDTSGQAKAFYQANQALGTDTLTTGIWYRQGMSWDNTVGTGSLDVKDSGAWGTNEDTNEGLVQISENFDYICIGAPTISSTSVNTETWVDNIYFINGVYEAADPMP